jgi:hypothetical protein
MEASGFGDEAVAIQSAFRAKDHEAMIEAVSPGMLDEMAAAGTVEDVRDQVARLEKRYDHAALYSPQLHARAGARAREHAGRDRGVRALVPQVLGDVPTDLVGVLEPGTVSGVQRDQPRVRRVLIDPERQVSARHERCPCRMPGPQEVRRILGSRHVLPSLASAFAQVSR